MCKKNEIIEGPTMEWPEPRAKEPKGMKHFTLEEISNNPILEDIKELIYKISPDIKSDEDILKVLNRVVDLINANSKE